MLSQYIFICSVGDANVVAVMTKFHARACHKYIAMHGWLYN